MRHPAPVFAMDILPFYTHSYPFRDIAAGPAMATHAKTRPGPCGNGMAMGEIGHRRHPTVRAPRTPRYVSLFTMFKSRDMI